MGVETVWVPTADHPPTYHTAETVAQLIRISVPALRSLIRRGCVPSPDYLGDVEMFPLRYGWFVKRFGPSFPGTYHYIPPPPVSETKAKAKRKAKKKAGGYKRPRPLPTKPRKPAGGKGGVA